MRRHPGLRGLSQEHHYALLFAKRLQAYRHADEAWLVQQADALHRSLRAFWDGALAAHFAAEEQRLPWARLSPVWRTRLRQDHERIAQLWREASVAAPERTLITRLGSELAAHARWEERELLPAVEAAAPQSELRALEDSFRDLPDAALEWLPPPVEAEKRTTAE
jgi:hypothetical protein